MREICCRPPSSFDRCMAEAPTIDLVMGYNRSNSSPLLLKLDFWRRTDELVARVSPKGGSEISGTS